jgi:hypothetical protein
MLYLPSAFMDYFRKGKHFHTADHSAILITYDRRVYFWL